MIDVKRKVVHAVGILTIFLIILLGKWISSLIVLCIAIGFFLLGEYRKDKEKYKIIKSKKLDEFEEYVENGFKEYERPNTDPFEGAIEFFVGSFFAIILFEPKAAMAAIAVLSLADAVSTLIGRNYGKHKVIFNKDKSIEGSMAFFITALPTLMFFSNPLYTTSVNLLYAATIAFFATLAELLPKVNDNITIPIVVGILMTIIS